MKNNLKQIRMSAGKLQKEVADDLGMPLSTYRSYEHNTRSLKGDMLKTLSAYFGVTVDDIIGTQFSTIEESAKFELSDSEMNLIDIFRSLNKKGKTNLLDYADTLVRSGKYQKKNLQDYQISAEAS